MTSQTTDLVSHTPGPWEGEPQGDGLGVRVWDKAGHNMIAALDEDAAAGACFVPDVQTREANARVIAAAPDLLASLKEMGDWIAAGLEASGEAWPDAKCLQHTEEIAARARAAVDKAEGRLPREDDGRRCECGYGCPPFNGCHHD